MAYSKKDNIEEKDIVNETLQIFDDYSNLCATEFIGNINELIKMALK